MAIVGSKVEGINWAKHDFKLWVDQVVNKHFAPSIAKRFYGVFEVERYNKKNKNIIRQLKDQKYIMEVYYMTPSDIHIYICDLFSDWSKEVVELQLLRYITDKVKTGQIGQDWDDVNGKVSPIIIRGDLATKGVS